MYWKGWIEGGKFKSGPFLCRKYKRGIKESVFFHRVNTSEHNIKQNIYTDMEVISLIAKNLLH